MFVKEQMPPSVWYNSKYMINIEVTFYVTIAMRNFNFDFDGE